MSIIIAGRACYNSSTNTKGAPLEGRPLISIDNAVSDRFAVFDGGFAGLADLYLFAGDLLFIENLYAIALADRAGTPAAGKE